ncbi:MAG: sodium:solute symporter family protein [Oscillospiraceae bacterium]|nr:sodium:solute symporter family protein [Oscillospiraceae bacterium]
MQNNATVWITILLYIALMVGIGVYTSRSAKSVADIVVGGRSAGAWLSALSYGTAYFSAVMFVGYAGGAGLNYGLWAISAGIGNAVFGSWLAWKVLARRTRDVSHRLKLKSMPQYFEARYGSQSMKTFSCLVIFIFLIPYSASVYKGIASVADVLLGINDTICLVIIAGLAALMLLFGGYLTQARADFAQGIIMMVGVALLIIFVVRSDRVGGLAGVAEYARTKAGLPDLTFEAALSLIATVLMTSFGTWGLPHMIQKYYGIRDDEQAKRGVIISTFFAILIAGGGYFIGSLCYRFFTADEIAGFPSPAQDYVMPNILKVSNLPSVLIGIVLVLLIAASVTTLCSITLTASSTLTMDFLKEKSKKGMSDKKVGNVTKILCLVFVLISYVVANTKTPILDMMSYSWGIVSGSFLAPYALALFYKKLSKGGAWCGILGGFFTAVIPASCKVITMFGVDNARVVYLAGKGPVFAVAAMIFSIILCLVTSAAFRDEKDEKTAEFFYNAVVENE